MKIAVACNENETITENLTLSTSPLHKPGIAATLISAVSCFVLGVKTPTPFGSEDQE